MIDQNNDKTDSSSSFVANIEDFSAMCTEAVHVIDFEKQCFSFVPNYNLFLYGYPIDEVMQLNYTDFYSKIVHKDDISLLLEIYKTIIESCNEDIDMQNEIKYFSCTFRIKVYSEFTKRQEYLMICHKIKPKFIEGKIKFGVCLSSSSVIKSSGNLRLYYKDELYFDEYSLTTKRWRKRQVESLSERETRILRFAKQGMNNKIIADKLCISYDTLRRALKLLYEKLRVQTIEQAVIYATNHLLIFKQNQIFDKNQQKKKKKEIKLTPDILQRIQVALNNNQSINSIAKNENISEGSIRKAIKSKKLTKIE